MLNLVTTAGLSSSAAELPSMADAEPRKLFDER